MGLGSQRLSLRRTVNLGRALELDLWRAWAGMHKDGLQAIHICTTDHRHGWVWVHRGKPGEVQWEKKPLHFTTCRERFGDVREEN